MRAKVTGLCLLLCSGWLYAENVAAFKITNANDGYESLSSDPACSDLTFSSGSGINVSWYYDGPSITQFSTNSNMQAAYNDESWLEFAFDLSGSTISFDRLFMDNDTIVFTNTFKLGVAYDNGGGAFSETISGLYPLDINSGIDISGFSDAVADSTVRFRVIFYDDTRGGLGSAFYPVNSTLNGVAGSAAVFAGTVAAVPEPASAMMLFSGAFVGMAVHRLRRWASR